MSSKWSNLKLDAIRMRKAGVSIRSIEQTLGISRSTLSGWLEHINLTQKQKLKLTNNQFIALKKARIKATLWHNQQKEKRLKEAEKQATDLLSTIDE